MTLPNSECDPTVMASNYRDYVDQAALADEVGFDGVAVNEHHQTPFGTMPSPNVMAAAITQRTSRARIAVFGNAFPLRSTPMVSIEEYSMIDLLSNGRLEAGFVVGGGPEYYNFAMSPTMHAISSPRVWRWLGELGQNRVRSVGMVGTTSWTASTPGRVHSSSRTRPSGFAGGKPDDTRNVRQGGSRLHGSERQYWIG